MVQLPDDNAHDAGLNVPPAPLSFNNIAPVGVVGEDEVSVTVIANVTGAPGLVAEELGENSTAVESGVLEIDVLLLLVNTRLLSAIAGSGAKLPKNDE